MHTNLFAKMAYCINLQQPIAILKKMIVSDMHHRITYMHVKFYQIPVCRPVKTMHANLSAKNGMLHKFATIIAIFKKMIISDMHHRTTYMHVKF